MKYIAHTYVRMNSNNGHFWHSSYSRSCSSRADVLIQGSSFNLLDAENFSNESSVPVEIERRDFFTRGVKNRSSFSSAQLTFEQ